MASKISTLQSFLQTKALLDILHREARIEPLSFTGVHPQHFASSHGEDPQGGRQRHRHGGFLNPSRVTLRRTREGLIRKVGRVSGFPWSFLRVLFNALSGWVACCIFSLHQGFSLIASAPPSQFVVFYLRFACLVVGIQCPTYSYQIVGFEMVMISHGRIRKNHKLNKQKCAFFTTVFVVVSWCADSASLEFPPLAAHFRAFQISLTTDLLGGSSLLLRVRITPIYMSFRPFGRDPITPVGRLTNHGYQPLTSTGVILQVRCLSWSKKVGCPIIIPKQGPFPVFSVVLSCHLSSF